MIDINSMENLMRKTKYDMTDEITATLILGD